MNLRSLLSAFVPALLVVALSVYAIGHRPKTSEDARVLPGRPLAAYDDYYPIRANDGGNLYLDTERFEKAVDYFSTNPSPRAIADLIYLGNANHVTLMLEQQAKEKFLTLVNLPDYAAVAKVDAQKENLLQTYKDIVNGIGQTFSGTPVEIILHDTRNPLISIIALQNPISGRRLGDPNTNFGVEVIKTYSQTARGPAQAFVSYGLTLKNGKSVKSTTIPLFNSTYGLIGMICLNIDVSKVDGMDPAATARFLESFRLITENEAISELIENSKRRH
ncbi:MAG: PAS domain-containing protein [Rhodocyclaceae bacterium]|nr:PAS domain-containing protein [Rhodocyclaceae bacterium]